MSDTPDTGDSTEHLLRELFPEEHEELSLARAEQQRSDRVEDDVTEVGAEPEALLGGSPVTAGRPAARVSPEPEPTLGPAATPIDDEHQRPMVQQAHPAKASRSAIGLWVAVGLACLVGVAAVAGVATWISSGGQEADLPTATRSGEAIGSPTSAVESEQGALPVGESEEDPAMDYEVQAVDGEATLDTETDGTDALGRPLPALPDVLVPNTPDAETLPGYFPDPIDAPESGPYTVVHGGRFYLRGTVSSENVRQDLIRTNLTILPLEVLVIEYRLDDNEEWFLGDNYPVFLEDDVLFALGSTEVDERFVPLFEIGANLLLLDPGLGIRITGHTDADGNSEFNLELSRERAEAVRAQYLSFGVAEEQVIAEGKGETDPVAPNNTEEGRQANRRVDFEFVQLDG